MAVAWQSNTVTGSGPGSPSSSRTINKPASTAAGDTLIVSLMFSSNPGAFVSVPSGWTLEADIANSGTRTLVIYSRLVDGSEGASFTWSWTNANGNFLTCSRITGGDPAQAIEAIAGTTSGGTPGTAVTAPAITLDGRPALLMQISGVQAQRSWTPDGAMTERYDDTNTGGPAMELATQAVTLSGTTGTRTATLSSSGAWATVLLAIAEPDSEGEGELELGITFTLDMDGHGSGQTPSAGLRPLYGTLGCGDWTAQIARQGGGTILLEAAPTSMRASRARNDMSSGEAAFALSDVPDHCMGVLANLEAWAYELTLLRDGELAWVGPISDQLRFTRTSLTVSARDLFHWMERRTLNQDRLNFGDLSDTFEEYVLDALARDPSPNISIDKRPSGVSERREVLASDHRYAADALRDLGDSGVDFTMVGRTIRLRAMGGGDTVGLLLEEHVDDTVNASLDGILAASEVIVVGAAPEGSDIPVSGHAGGIDAEIGLVQQVYQEPLVVTIAGAEASALATFASSGVAPLQVQGRMNPEAPIEFRDLIPGNIIPVQMTIGLLHIDEPMLLDQVGVEASPDEQVTFSLVRREDA